MTPEQMRELADRLTAGTHYVDSPELHEAMMEAADFLRQCAEAEPIGYLGRDADEDVWMEMESWATNAIPLYAHPAPAVPTGDYSANGEPLYTPPAVPTIEERGPWSAGQDKQQAWEQRVWIESDDFAHDVRLYVNGDFESHDQRFAYAQEIARRLNAAPAAPQAEPKRDSVPIPHDADQAVLMTMVGVAWLQANAPDRLSTRFSELIKQRGGSNAE